MFTLTNVSQCSIELHLDELLVQGKLAIAGELIITHPQLTAIGRKPTEAIES